MVSPNPFYGSEYSMSISDPLIAFSIATSATIATMVAQPYIFAATDKIEYYTSEIIKTAKEKYHGRVDEK